MIGEAKEHIESGRFGEYRETVLSRKDLACWLEVAGSASWTGIETARIASSVRLQSKKVRHAGFGSAAKLMEDAASLAEMGEKEKAKVRIKAAFRLVSASQFRTIADELEKDGEPEKCAAASLLFSADRAIQNVMPRSALALLERTSELLEGSALK